MDYKIKIAKEENEMGNLVMLASYFKNRFLSPFLKEEKGASTLVEIIVVIVIILAVAVIFRDQLTQIVTNVMQQLTDFTGGGE